MLILIDIIKKDKPINKNVSEKKSFNLFKFQKSKKSAKLKNLANFFKSQNMGITNIEAMKFLASKTRVDFTQLR